MKRLEIRQKIADDRADEMLAKYIFSQWNDSQEIQNAYLMTRYFPLSTQLV